jgi:ComF family protein
VKQVDILDRAVSIARSLQGGVLDIVYPRTCEGCGAAMQGPGFFCWDCLRQSEKVARPFCEKCGDPVDGLVEGTYECSWCSRNRPLFERARSVFRYKGPVKRAVHQFKYGAAVHLAPDMAELMAAAVRSLYAGVPFDVAVGVPLFPRKERERGYNQAALLASRIARSLKIDCFNSLLARVRDTETQTELSAADRKKNMKGAFEVRYPDWILERHVLVVDDVMTTGATAGELAMAIMHAEAASVHVISFARG